MDLLFNDLSIHEQFHDIDSFHQALERLMEMRAAAKHFDWEVYCNSNLVNTSPGRNFSMQQAVNQLRDKNKCRAIMLWLTKSSFWDTSEQRKHRENDLLECVNQDHQVVTDTAVGEAAFRMLHDGSTCGIISIKPSDWEFSPVNVIYLLNGNGKPEDQLVNIDNFLDLSTLESGLQDIELPIDSWDDLKKTTLNRFNRLTFAKDCFEPLASLSFAQVSAKTLIARLDVLSQLANARDKDGAQSLEEQQIYKKHFMGDKAWFSDSSETEKQRFKGRLTFPHPERPGHILFCPYHGKERHLQLRLHFSWPIQPGQPVYVVYIGPKLTKR